MKIKNVRPGLQNLAARAGILVFFICGPGCVARPFSSPLVAETTTLSKRTLS